MSTRYMLTIQKTEHYVADALLAAQHQLAAIFRGDREAYRIALIQEERAVADAIRSARKVLENK